MNGTRMTLPNKQKVDWKRYNLRLRRRGDLTVYIGTDLSAKWDAGPSVGQRGRPLVYPEPVILLGLVLQQVYRLPLRQTVGLMRSVVALVGMVLPIPDPSTLSRRRRHVTLPAWPKAGACIVIDSTGLQIRGPNTWLTTVHGHKRRTYRKIHLGIDPESSRIVSGVVSTCQKHDSEMLAEVLRVADPAQGTEIIGDGAYDRKMCYEAARRRCSSLITPPGKRAILHREPGWTERDCAIRECRLLGRRAWKRIKGYHRRSLAESAMHRLKAAFGPSLRSRRCSNQVGEALLRAHILNSWNTPKNLFKA